MENHTSRLLTVPLLCRAAICGHWRSPRGDMGPQINVLFHRRMWQPRCCHQPQNAGKNLRWSHSGWNIEFAPLQNKAEDPTLAFRHCTPPRTIQPSCRCHLQTPVSFGLEERSLSWTSKRPRLGLVSTDPPSVVTPITLLATSYTCSRFRVA